MALSVFIPDSELAALEPQVFFISDSDESVEELTAHENAFALFSSSGQEQEGVDLVDGPAESPVRPYQNYSAEAVATDAAEALKEEHPTKVEKLFASAEETLTPTVVFDRCWFLLEPTSKSSFTRCRYCADVALCCRRALKSEPMLLHLYKMLFEQNHCAEIPLSVLRRSPLVNEIRYRCGKALRRLRLWNFTEYSRKTRRNHQGEGRTTRV